MNITINIPALSELAKSIDNIAAAMTTINQFDARLVRTTVTGDGAGETKITTSEDGSVDHIETTHIVTATPPEITNGEDTSATEPTLTPTEKQKNAINKEIVALGGTPLESGSLVKHQDALTALQEAAKTPVEEIKETPATEKTPIDQVSALVDEVEGTPEHTLTNVLALAGYVVRTQDDWDGKNSVMGKTKLSACLKKVGSPKVTSLFQPDFNAKAVALFVPLLMSYTGNKSFAEIVAEAKAQANA